MTKQDLIYELAGYVGGLHVAAHHMTPEGCQAEVREIVEEMRKLLHEAHNQKLMPLWMSGEPFPEIPGPKAKEVKA